MEVNRDFIADLLKPPEEESVYTALEELAERFSVSFPTVNLDERERRELEALVKRYRDGDDVEAEIVDRFGFPGAEEVRS